VVPDVADAGPAAITTPPPRKRPAAKAKKHA
jgi:hypothetical protein